MDELSQDAQKNRTSAIVVALFDDPDRASDAITDLKEAGFQEEDIGVAMQDRAEPVVPEVEPGTRPATGEGMARGALSGGIVGGALGLLGSLLLPGVGPIVAGGILGSLLMGAGIGAATGGLIGVLVGMGISKEEAEHFDRGFRAGGILVTVRADARSLEARAILRERNADLGPSFENETVSAEPDGTPRRARWYDSEESAEPWRGIERRGRMDPEYAGPERRVAAV
jgi:hypothetical protein